MATQKTLNTRIKLRYDTFDNWTSSNPVLMAGEVAVVVVPAEQNDNLQTTKPALLMKAGDGSTQFNSLPWFSGLAADVYGWAKAKTKPTYIASEVGAAAETHNHVAADITDFDEKVKALISGNIKDTNTTYQIVANGTNSFKLQSKDIGGDWTDVEGSIFTVDLSAVNAAIAAKYTKPAGGIPKTDLEEAVRTSLSKADTALQEVKNGSITNEKLDEDLQSKVAQAHNHSNKTELDKIVTGDKAKWDQAASDVAGKENAGVAAGLVSTHNQAGDAHNDIRKLITALQETVGGLGNALHFVGAGEDASKPAEGKDGDVYIATDTNKEYVWSGEGWKEFGSPEHLTKAQADGYYDPKGSAKSVEDTLKPKITENETAIAGLKDGTVKAGDANKLGGQLPAYYATESDLTSAEERIAALEKKPGLDKTGTVTSVAAGTGLKVTGSASVNPTIDFDDTVEFVFDCGNSQNRA